MTKHSRLPAVAMLLFSLLLGIAAMAVAGQFRRATTLSVADLESQIAAGKADGATWAAYAEALQSSKAFHSAGEAYAKAIQLDPEKKGLRFNEALCLGEAGDTEKFFEAINHLSATDPKLAVDVLERPEIANMRQDGRFAPALKSAHSQAAD